MRQEEDFVTEMSSTAPSPLETSRTDESTASKVGHGPASGRGLARKVRDVLTNPFRRDQEEEKVSLRDTAANKENEPERDGRTDYGNKSRYVQMWVEEDSQIALEGRLRDPNSLTPETQISRPCSGSTSGTDIVDKVQATCESAIANTCDLLADMQSGIVRSLDAATRLLEKVESETRQNMVMRQDKMQSLASENRYLQGELVEARAALDRVFHAVFKSKDARDHTPETMVAKIVKRMRHLESMRKTSSEQVGKVTEDRNALRSKAEGLHAEVRTMKTAELKMRNTLTNQKSKMDSYKHTIKEQDEAKRQLLGKIDHLEARLGAQADERAEMTEEIENLKREGEERQSKLEQMQSILQTAQRKRAMAEKALENAESQIEVLSNKVLDQAVQVSETVQEKDGIEIERQDLEEKLAEALRREETLNEDLESASRESSAKGYRVHELRASLSEMNTKVKSAEEEYRELQEDYEGLERDLTASNTKVSELKQKVADLTRKGESFASLLPKHIDVMTSNLGKLYSELEGKVDAKEKELASVCTRFCGVVSQLNKKTALTNAFNKNVESRLVHCLGLLGRSEGGALPAPESAGLSTNALACENIQRNFDALELCIRNHIQAHRSLKDTSECQEVNMVQAQNEVESLKEVVEVSERTREQNQAEEQRLVQERDELRERVSSYSSMADNLKEAIHKRSCASVESSSGSKEGRIGQEAGDEDLVIAVKLLLEDLQKSKWDRECIQQDLNTKEECISRLRYKVASYSTAVRFNSKKLEAYSKSSERKAKDFHTKQKELLAFNEQLYSDLELKERAIADLRNRLVEIARRTSDQEEKLQEVGQCTDVQLYKISSSFRCLDDIETNILGYFESMKERVASKESEMDAIAKTLKHHMSRSQDLERNYTSVSAQLTDAQRERQTWKVNYQRMKKMIGVYLPRLKLKLKESKSAKLRARALRKRNKHLTKKVQILERVQLRGLRQVRSKIARTVRRDFSAETAKRSSFFAGRIWHLTWTSAKKESQLESLAKSAMQEKQTALERLKGAVLENNSLKASIGKQSEMLAHLYELEEFLQRSKETIQDLQNSVEEKEKAIQELRASKTTGENQRSKIQEKTRLLEARLLKTQEDLVVTQNQCAVTTKEHLRLIEKYSLLQSNIESLEQNATAAKESLESERSTSSEHKEQNQHMKEEILAKEHRIKELRCALSSVCTERDEAEEKLQNSSVSSQPPPQTNPRVNLQPASTQTESTSSDTLSVALQTEALGVSEPSDHLEAQAEILLLHSEVGALKSKLKKSEEAGQAKQEDLAALKAKVANLESELRAKEESLTHLQDVLDNALESLAESTQEMLEMSVDVQESREAAPAPEAPSHQLRAVEGVIATWREACHKRDREIERLRSKIEVLGHQFSEFEKESENKSERQTAILQENLRDAYTELKSFALDLEKHKRKLAKVHGSNQKSMRVLTKALSGHKPTSVPESLEEASKDVSNLVSTLAEEVRQAKQKHAKSKSCARENSEIAISMQVKSIAPQESLHSKEGRIKELKGEIAALEEKALALESKQTLVDSYRSRLTKTECDLSNARAKIDNQNRDLKEMNKMLKAWEAMRTCKDSQISALLEKCKQYEDQVAEKARSVSFLRQKIAARTTRKSPCVPSDPERGATFGPKDPAVLGNRTNNVPTKSRVFSPRGKENAPGRPATH